MTYATPLNIEPIPLEYCNHVKENFDSYKVIYRSFFSDVLTISALPDIIEAWLKTHIADIQWFTGKFKSNYPAVHRDNGLAESFWFLVQQGNPGVESIFYAPDGKTVIERQVLEENRWHLFKNDIWHNQGGLKPGNERIIIWGKAHTYHPTWRAVTKYAVDDADYRDPKATYESLQRENK